MSMRLRIFMSVCFSVFAGILDFGLSAESYTSSSTPVSDTFTYVGDEYRLYINGDHIYAALERYKRNDDLQNQSIYIPPMAKYEGKHFPVEEIGDEVFENYGETRRITIPAYIKRIGKNAFKGCSASEYVKFEYNDSQIEIEEGAFEGFVTKKLIIGASLNFVSTSTNNIKVEDTIEYSFNIKNIPQYVNLDLSGVKDFIVGSDFPPTIDFDNIKMMVPSVGSLHVPYYCKEKYRYDLKWCVFDNIIEDVQLVITSDGINYIVNEEKDGVTGFCYSNGKERIDLPEYVDYGDKSFPLHEISNITAADLKTVSIPCTIKELWGPVFLYCENLECVIIRDSKEKLVQHEYLCNYFTTQFNPVKKFYIGRNYLPPREYPEDERDLVGYIFTLEELTFGKEVTEIPRFTIGEHSICDNLRDVYSYNPIPPKAYFTTFSKLPSGVVLHVPEGSLELYCMAVGWNNFLTIVEDAENTSVKSFRGECENKKIYDLQGRSVSSDHKEDKLIKRNDNIEIHIR